MSHRSEEEYQRAKIEEQTLRALKNFTEKLESGEPIPVIEVNARETDDGIEVQTRETTLDEVLDRQWETRRRQTRMN